MNLLDEIVKLKRSNFLKDEKVFVESHCNFNYSLYKIDKVILSNNVEDDDEELKYRVEKFLRSFSNDKRYLGYCIKGNKEKNDIEIFLVNYDDEEDLGKRIGGYFEGIKYSIINNIDDFGEFGHSGLITGIPNIEKVKNVIDDFIKGMTNKDFILSVVSKPFKIGEIEKIQDNLITEINNNYINIKENINKTNTKTTTNSHREGKNKNTNGGAAFIFSKTESSGDSNDYTTGLTCGETNSTGIEKFNSAADEYNNLLQDHLKRMMAANSEGLWQTSICISTKNEHDLKLALEIFKSIYNSGSLEPFNSYISKKSINPISMLNFDTFNNNKEHIIYGEKELYVNILTTEELALFFQFPKKEHNGYSIKKVPRFSQQNLVEKNDLNLGYLYDSEVRTNIPFGLSKNSLLKHVFIGGITGSGKTNTVFSILKNLDVPFLVIDPVKTEYRGLKSIVKDLRIYTLGKEEISPFRLNPFKFEKNITVQQHIDNLKVIFTAAFTMYASMPNILEQCLNNIYIKKGWDLITSKNIYEGYSIVDQLYPTIEDLYSEINNYLDSLGYAEEQTQNMRAALLTRIKSLMIGGKGYMLNTSKSIGIEELLKYPTVLELDGVADDEEKSLVIGFIMMDIYEFLKGNIEGYENSLKHIVVMEEAHRIFANTLNLENQEMVNIKGKAVENLSNILCEVRAYGEGFIVVDQVPVKLSSDVLKNTNTKIIHRIVSKEDCEYIGNSLNITDEKINYISELTVGSALIYNEKMDNTCHVKMNESKDELVYLRDCDIKEWGKIYNRFINLERSNHPLADMVLQIPEVAKNIFNVVSSLIDKVLQEDLKDLNKSYCEVVEKLKWITMEYGYDSEYIDLDQYIDTLIRQSIKIIVNQKVTNNFIKRAYLNKVLSSGLEIIQLDFKKNEKLYRAFDISRMNVNVRR